MSNRELKTTVRNAEEKVENLVNMVRTAEQGVDNLVKLVRRMSEAKNEDEEEPIEDNWFPNRNQLNQIKSGQFARNSQENVIEKMERGQAYSLLEDKSGKFFGYCLIMNQSVGRSGSEFDLRCLSELFRGQLGFYVDVLSDCTAERFREKMSELTSGNNLATFSSFFIVLMAHGEGDQLKMHDCMFINIESDVIKKLGKCRALTSKPKLVLVQACEGQGKDLGIEPDDVADECMAEKVTEVRNRRVSDGYLAAERRASMQDMHVFRATHLPVQAMRSRYGTVFIQAWCEVVKRGAHFMDMARITERVINLMGRFTIDGVYQIASVRYNTLACQFFFRSAQPTAVSVVINTTSSTLLLVGGMFENDSDDNEDDYDNSYHSSQYNYTENIYDNEVDSDDDSFDDNEEDNNDDTLTWATTTETFNRTMLLHPDSEPNTTMNRYQAFLYGNTVFGFLGYTDTTASLMGLDLPENKLHNVTEHPCAYEFFSSCQMDKKNLLLSCGGADADGDSLKSAHLFDLETFEWKHQLPEMQKCRRSHSLVSFNGSPMAIGGYDRDFRTDLRKTTERLVMGGGHDRWIAGPPLQQDRYCHSSVDFNKTLVVAGGGPKDHLTKSVETLDGRMDKWQSGPSLNQPRRGFPLVVHDDKLFAIGGITHVNENWELLDTTEWWDSRWPQWHQGPNLRRPRFRHGAVEIPNRLLPK